MNRNKVEPNEAIRRIKKIIFLLLGGIMLSCSSNDKNTIVLENSSAFDRVDAGIAIPFSSIEAQCAKNVDLLPVLKDEEGQLIPTQLDDMDGDGQWDEMFLVTNFKGLEKKKVTLAFVAASEYPEFEIRTNIRFAKKDVVYKEVNFATREKHALNYLTQEIWQMEGMAWENDKVGFRNYFDRRNGMDIFGKVTTKMVLDQVGYKDNLSYHKFNPEWGVDVLKVGNSLGAGSIAYQFNDSLYRVGDNGTGTAKVLIEGPLRSIYRLEFTDWEMKDQSISVTHDVSIEAGKYYFENKVRYTGTEENLQLVTGIVNIKSKELFEVNSNDKVNAYYTYDHQAEDTTLLGMGIMVLSKDFLKQSDAPKAGEGITQSYCIHISSKENAISSYRFYTVWEKENSKWKTAEAFEQLLESEADFMANPVIVSLGLLR
ncbi:MAG: DUF4861 domain-containing protein [Bacteroidales bacterium]|jgi:hypothetical protein|nr:DUF4861 domain-containing protein [Bacteroidales bacterium]